MSKPEPAKVAVSVAKNKDGSFQTVTSAFGEKAQEMIEEAEKNGLPVISDERQVKSLLREEGPKSCIPVEIYELMAAVIDFAQDLNRVRVDMKAEMDGEGQSSDPYPAEE